MSLDVHQHTLEQQWAKIVHVCVREAGENLL